MNNIKRLIFRIVLILFILCGGLTLVINFFNYYVDTLKWILFIDNAETGLSLQWEMVVKGLMEAVILGIAVCFGISKNNLFISVLVIILGFACCTFFYYTAKYIIWILVALVIILAATITYTIIQKRKEA